MICWDLTLGLGGEATGEPTTFRLWTRVNDAGALTGVENAPGTSRRVGLPMIVHNERLLARREFLKRVEAGTLENLA